MTPSFTSDRYLVGKLQNDISPWLLIVTSTSSDTLTSFPRKSPQSISIRLSYWVVHFALLYCYSQPLLLVYECPQGRNSLSLPTRGGGYTRPTGIDPCTCRVVNISFSSVPLPCPRPPTYLSSYSSTPHTSRETQIKEILYPSFQFTVLTSTNDL